MLTQTQHAKNIHEILVALAGNPNSGKTSVFNALTGGHQHVGNWPGVTIERVEGFVTVGEYTLRCIDLPGTYNLSPYTPEEAITRSFLIDEKPDVVVDVIDTTNMERHLYYTTQLMELGVPMVLVLNMFDEATEQGLKINTHLLSQLLGMPVVPTCATKKEGITTLADTILALKLKIKNEKLKVRKQGRIEGQARMYAQKKLVYADELEDEVAVLIAYLEQDDELVAAYPVRWLALQLIEGDALSYRLVHHRTSLPDIDSILAASKQRLIKHYEKEPAMIVALERHGFARGAVREAVVYTREHRDTSTEKWDAVLLHRVWGLPLFLFFMWCVFQLTFVVGKIPAHWLEQGFTLLGGGVRMLLPDGTLQSMLVDGVITGVGGVLMFIPYILILFMALSFMENSGYMARVAFLVDRFMHRIGLHGKSCIPMVMGFGCSVPAFMACRTLKNRKDQLATMLVIPFISCGAKLPVYALIIGAFFPTKIAGTMLFGIYLFGVAIALCMARLLKSTVLRGSTEPFVMELPFYRMPTLTNTLMHMWEKALLYLKKAGTIILVASIAIWYMLHFPIDKQYSAWYARTRHTVQTHPSLDAHTKAFVLGQYAARKQHHDIAYSYAGRVGKAIEPVIAPLGFDWRIGVALLAGVSAKEVIVATMNTITYAETDAVSRRDGAFLRHIVTPVTALTLLVFVLLYMPCVSATVVFCSEAMSFAWTGFLIVYTMLTAYGVAYCVHQCAAWGFFRFIGV